MKKVNAVIKVSFYLDKKGDVMVHYKPILNAIRKNINGWEYSKAEVGIESVVDVDPMAPTRRHSGIINEIEI